MPVEIREVFVHPHGDDSASGTIEHPLRSITTAVARLGGAGGFVTLREGLYFGEVEIADVHASYDVPLVIRAAPDERAVLSRGPFDLFQNTCRTLDAGTRDEEVPDGNAASFTHYRTGVRASNSGRRRAFNNIFVAVHRSEETVVPIAFLPAPDFEGPTTATYTTALRRAPRATRSGFRRSDR